MSGQQVRSAIGARLESIGYRWLTSARHDDVFLDDRTGHQATVVPWPRWSRRVDVLTVMSSFPLPHDERARAFHLDLGSQISVDGAALAGRWGGRELIGLFEQHMMPFLARARSARDVLDMLLDGEVRPMGSSAARTVVQHGYYLAKWWGLADRLEALRSVAQLVPVAQRDELEHAPWGRTELAEVLWHGRALPEPPSRVPWGLADQGDPRAERWYQQASRLARNPEPVPESAAQGAHGRSAAALQTPGSF